MTTLINKGSAGVPVATYNTQGYGTTTSAFTRDVGSKLFYLDPNANPFTLLTDRAGSKVAVEPKFEWYEKALRAKWTQLNDAANVATGVYTLTVDDGLVVQANDIILVPRTGELMRVVSSTTTVITVENPRGLGASTEAIVLDNDDIVVIGSAWNEGADVGIPDEWEETHKFNYTQIFRLPFGATRTREASQSYLGKSRPRLRAEKGIEHAIDLERAYLFGNKLESGSGNTVFRMTGGFMEFATSNIVDLAGVQLSEPDLEGWMEDLFAHGSAGSSRTVFASALVISAFDQLAADKLRMVPSDKTYGIAVNQYLTSHGTLNLVKHRLLEDGLSAGGNGYQDWAFAVDVSSLTNRPLAGATTKLLGDRQGPGVDGWIDEYLTECGLQFTNPENAGILKNVGAAV